MTGLSLPDQFLLDELEMTVEIYGFLVNKVDVVAEIFVVNKVHVKAELYGILGDKESLVRGLCWKRSWWTGCKRSVWRLREVEVEGSVSEPLSR